MRDTIWLIFFGSVMHDVNEARCVVARDWDRLLTSGTGWSSGSSRIV
jgi:hypothetical protein